MDFDIVDKCCYGVSPSPNRSPYYTRSLESSPSPMQAPLVPPIPDPNPIRDPALQVVFVLVVGVQYKATERAPDSPTPSPHPNLTTTPTS